MTFQPTLLSHSSDSMHSFKLLQRLVSQNSELKSQIKQLHTEASNTYKKLKDERRLKQIQDKDLTLAKDRIAELCFHIGDDIDAELEKL